MSVRRTGERERDRTPAEPAGSCCDDDDDADEVDGWMRSLPQSMRSSERVRVGLFFFALLLLLLALAALSSSARWTGSAGDEDDEAAVVRLGLLAALWRGRGVVRGERRARKLPQVSPARRAMVRPRRSTRSLDEARSDDDDDDDDEDDDESELRRPPPRCTASLGEATGEVRAEEEDFAARATAGERASGLEPPEVRELSPFVRFHDASPLDLSVRGCRSLPPLRGPARQLVSRWSVDPLRLPRVVIDDAGCGSPTSRSRVRRVGESDRERWRLRSDMERFFSSFRLRMRRLCLTSSDSLLSLPLPLPL